MVKMPVDNEDLREVLRLFPIYQIRMIIEEREIGVKSRDQEELIDALVEEEWTEKEYRNLIERLQTIQEEGRPLGYYLHHIKDGPEIEELEQELRTNEAEFDDQGRLLEDGYQIHHISETELEATRWKIDIEREFNFRTGEVEKEENVKPVEFSVKFDENRVFINTNQYGKAQNVSIKLKEVGFEFYDIGHRNMNSEEANQQVKGFVEALQDKVE